MVQNLSSSSCIRPICPPSIAAPLIDQGPNWPGRRTRYATVAVPKSSIDISEQIVTHAIEDQNAYAAAERLLGVPLVLPLGPGEPEVGNDFKRLATRHAFGDSWTARAWTPVAEL